MRAILGIGYIDPTEVAAIIDEQRPYHGCTIVLKRTNHTIRVPELSAAQVDRLLTTDAE